MNIYRTVLSAVILLLGNIGLAQGQTPSEPVWGLYAAGVGEKLKPGIDPCWITYTVALDSNKRIIENVENGLMGVIMSGVNWHSATAGQRTFGRYFEDKPDGLYKLTACEVPECAWKSVGKGDVPANDRALSIGPIPADKQCSENFTGTGAVCWSANQNGKPEAWCTYKTLNVGQIRGGNNPGRLFECTCD